MCVFSLLPSDAAGGEGVGLPAEGRGTPEEDSWSVSRSWSCHQDCGGRVVPSFPESLSFPVYDMGAPLSPWGCSECPISRVLSWGWVLWRPFHLTLG